MGFPKRFLISVDDNGVYLREKLHGREISSSLSVSGKPEGQYDVVPLRWTLRRLMAVRELLRECRVYDGGRVARPEAVHARIQLERTTEMERTTETLARPKRVASGHRGRVGSDKTGTRVTPDVRGGIRRKGQAKATKGAASRRTSEQVAGPERP